MIIRSAEFIKSSVSVKDCPEPTLPEYAFFGRSNVGKSSLINMITGHSKLAKISGTPGKTQLINHFLINSQWYLADLPGFGFAKVSMSTRSKWEGMIKSYLLRRSNLVCCFLLIDLRHKPLKNDLEFMAWFASHQVPFYLVFTKADKLSQYQGLKALKEYNKELSKQWEPVPPGVISSCKTQLGKDTLLKLIEEWNSSFVVK